MSWVILHQDTKLDATKLDATKLAAMPLMYLSSGPFKRYHRGRRLATKTYVRRQLAKNLGGLAKDRVSVAGWNTDQLQRPFVVTQNIAQGVKEGNRIGARLFVRGLTLFFNFRRNSTETKNELVKLRMWVVIDRRPSKAANADFWQHGPNTSGELEDEDFGTIPHEYGCTSRLGDRYKVLWGKSFDLFRNTNNAAGAFSVVNKRIYVKINRRIRQDYTAIPPQAAENIYPAIRIMFAAFSVDGVQSHSIDFDMEMWTHFNHG